MFKRRGSIEYFNYPTKGSAHGATRGSAYGTAENITAGFTLNKDVDYKDDLSAGNFLKKISPPEARIILIEQVHGPKVESVSPRDIAKEKIKVVKGVDGVFLEGFKSSVAPDMALPLVAVGVRVADCMPVFGFSEGKLLGGFHAGRRSLAGGIAVNFLEKAVSAGHKKENLKFFTGPHICGSCYEISNEDAAAFPSEALNGRYLDMFKGLRIDLERVGINKEQVRLFKNKGYCTYENKEYCSYRRKDKKRSMAFAIQG